MFSTTFLLGSGPVLDLGEPVSLMKFSTRIMGPVRLGSGRIPQYIYNFIFLSTKGVRHQ